MRVIDQRNGELPEDFNRVAFVLCVGSRSRGISPLLVGLLLLHVEGGQVDPPEGEA